MCHSCHDFPPSEPTDLRLPIGSIGVLVPQSFVKGRMNCRRSGGRVSSVSQPSPCLSAASYFNFIMVRFFQVTIFPFDGWLGLLSTSNNVNFDDRAQGRRAFRLRPYPSKFDLQSYSLYSDDHTEKYIQYDVPQRYRHMYCPFLHIHHKSVSVITFPQYNIYTCKILVLPPSANYYVPRYPGAAIPIYPSTDTWRYYHIRGNLSPRLHSWRYISIVSIP